MKATGVNSHTRAQLKSLMEEGYTAEEISSMIQVEESVCKNWMKHFAPEVEVEAEVEKKPKAKVSKKKSSSK